MRNLIITLITINIAGSFLCSVLGSDSKLSKYVAYVVSLSIVCTITSPVFTLIGYISNIGDVFNFELEDYSAESNQSLTDLMLEKTDLQLKAATSQMLNSKFSLNLSSDNVTFIYNEEDKQNLSIKKVTVDTSDSFLIKDMYEIKYFLEDYFMCECEVR